MRSWDAIKEYPWPVSLLVYCRKTYEPLLKWHSDMALQSAIAVDMDNDLATAKVMEESIDKFVGPKATTAIRRRFKEKKPLREIGEEFGVTYESVRTLIKEGCIKLYPAVLEQIGKTAREEMLEKKTRSVWCVPIQSLKMRPEIESYLLENFNVRTVHDLISLPARDVLKLWSTYLYFNSIKLALSKNGLVFLNEKAVDDLVPLYSAEILPGRCLHRLAEQDILTLDDFVARVSYDDLLSSDGIGPVKASEIVARLNVRGKRLIGTPESVIRMGNIRRNGPGERPVYSVLKGMSPTDMADMLAINGFMDGNREEILGWLCSPYEKKEKKEKKRNDGA